MKTEKFYIVLLSVSLLIFSAALLITDFRNPKSADAACVKMPMPFGGMFVTGATTINNPYTNNTTCQTPYAAKLMGTFLVDTAGNTATLFVCTNP